MPLPRGDEYLAAVQNPRTAFSDVELKVCRPETDQFGIPKPYSGGFTTTFHLQNHSQHWATRCFTRAIPDLQKRYEAVGRFLQRNSDGFLVKAACLNQGIRVGSQWHPIIKMQWLEGEILNTFIARNISSPATISKIIPEFVSLVRRLENLGVAHGDLQHGNILVKQGKLYLIDYDGFFLSELSSLKTNEIGHLNYQHPARSAAHYNARIDRFSSIVIYLGLSAIALLPSLWQKYDNSENILFRANDFANVEKSPLLIDISSIQQLTPLVERFRGVSRLDFDKLPTLDQFISGNFAYPKVFAPTVAIPTRRSQYSVIDASRSGSLTEHIGDRVEVIGFITDYHSARTRYRQPYLFLNFGSYPRQTFTLVLWSTSLTAFSRADIDPLSLIGKWVKVTGVLGSYRRRPQMTLELPSQVQILYGENEAHQWLGVKPSVSTPSQTFRPISQEGESVFNTIYAGRSATPVTTTPTPTTPAKKFDSSHGIIGSLILGVVGAAIWGFWGFVAGAVIGYQIGKRL
jgi:serine/threonine protein kinase